MFAWKEENKKTVQTSAPSEGCIISKLTSFANIHIENLILNELSPTFREQVKI